METVFPAEILAYYYHTRRDAYHHRHCTTRLYTHASLNFFDEYHIWGRTSLSLTAAREGLVIAGTK
jgi:hypothetical protein